MGQQWKKILLGVFVMCLLVVSFWYGGNAPGLQGFSVSTTEIAEEANKVQPASTMNMTDVSDAQGDRNGTDDDKESDNIFKQFFMNIKLKKSTTSSNKTQTNKQAQQNANQAVKKKDKKAEEEHSDVKKRDEKSSVKKEDSSKKEETNHSNTQQENTTGVTTESLDTEATTEKETEQTTEAVTVPKDTVTIFISCKTLLNNMDLLKDTKKSFVPKDGIVLKKTEVEIEDGDTVFEVLQRATKNHNIHLEYNYTPAYKSYYIEGIHNIYEFDAGNLSGWMCCINGEFTGTGCSFYKVKAGDEIQWVYTCNWGKDVGDSLE